MHTSSWIAEAAAVAALALSVPPPPPPTQTHPNHHPPDQQGFVPHACASAEAYLAAEVVGQELAIRQLTDAVCHHLQRARPGRPLIISAHGPPGVGKTLTHQLLARALFQARPSEALQCPGKDCRGYKVGGRGGVGGWGLF